MSNTIHFNEIMGTNVKRFTTASELLLAFELNKYTQKTLNKVISIDGIEIIKNIEKSEHYSFIVNNGFNIGRVLDLDERENLTPYNNTLYFQGDVEGIVFKEKTDDLWVYERDFAVEVNNVLHKAYVSHAYLSLVAYMYVDAFNSGVKVPNLLIDHETHSQLENEYVDLLILRDWGNKLLKGKLDIKFCNAKGHQPEWETFVTVNRQRGYMAGKRIIDKKRNVSYEPYSRDVKIKYLEKNFEVGDVVLYYLRDNSGKKIGRLESCYPAVITAINNGLVTLTYYPISETRLTRNIEISNMVEMAEEESIYGESDYNKFHESVVTYDINDIGIDKATYLEPIFILKPLDMDGSYQYFDTPDGYKRVWLSTYDTIYAVFEDRGVRYNKEKFLTTYFTNGRTPVYEMYRGLTQENLAKDI